MKSVWAMFLAAAAALAMVSPSPATAGDDRSFSLVSWTTTATVATDGSMDVVEVITYDFEGGPFNFGIRSFDNRGDDITAFTATDEDGPLATIAPEESVSGDWEWELRDPTSDRAVQFTLEYRVGRAVEVGTDVGDLNWQFVGDDHSGIDTMTITVVLPPGLEPAQPDTADAEIDVLRGFAHGPSNGTIEVGESRLVAVVEGVDAGQFVEVRAVVPATAIAAVPPAQRIDRPLLAEILAEERELQDDESNDADDADRRRLGWIVTPLLAGLGLMGTGVLWLVGGRERRSTEVLGEYWREPLDDPPAVVAATLKRGTPGRGTVISSTLVDLAQRGYLRIAGMREERFGPDRTVYTFTRTERPLGPEVRPWERQLLETVLRGQTETTSSELTSWAEDNQSAANEALGEVVDGVDADFEAREYERAPSGRALTALVVGALVVGAGGFVVTRALDNGIGWVAVVVAGLMLAGGLALLKNRTPAGVEAAAKATGLRNYLRDFSRLDDAPIGHLILWERYLVYAVALGVSAELVRGLAARLPQIANDPAFSTWYVGPIGRLDGLDGIGGVGAATASASSPSSSGSSGGFSSGGSSGGGGGGGAGAR